MPSPTTRATAPSAAALLITSAPTRKAAPLPADATMTLVGTPRGPLLAAASTTTSPRIQPSAPSAAAVSTTLAQTATPAPLAAAPTITSPPIPVEAQIG